MIFTIPWPGTTLKHQPPQWHSPSWPSRSIQFGSKASLICLSSSSSSSVAQGCIQRPKQVLWLRGPVSESLFLPVVPHLGPQTCFGFDRPSPHTHSWSSIQAQAAKDPAGCRGFLRDSWEISLIWMCAVRSLSQGWFSLAEDESCNVTERLISQHRFSLDWICNRPRGWWVVWKTKHRLSGFCFECTWLASWSKRASWEWNHGWLRGCWQGWERQPLSPGSWPLLWFSGGRRNLLWKSRLVKKYGAWHFEPILSAPGIRSREDNSWNTEFSHSFSCPREIYLVDLKVPSTVRWLLI